MQKFCYFIFALLIACSSPNGNKEPEDIAADSMAIPDTGWMSLPEEIRGMPVGIEVWHEPDTLRAVRWERDTTRFVWKHQTFLFSYVSDLTIVEFGTYNYKNGEWVLGDLGNKKYGPEELAMWYVQYDDGMVRWIHPDHGKIEENVIYFDPSNYSIKNKELVQRNGLWYFIGKDSTGKSYCGYGRYVALPEMLH